MIYLGVGDVDDDDVGVDEDVSLPLSHIPENRNV